MRVSRWDTRNANVPAIAGLRKNFSVSNPSIGASFQAPPMAETQPARLPTPTRTASGSDAAFIEAAQSARSDVTATTPAAIARRRPRSFTTRPNTANCMGIAYFDWSSSRMKVL
jgi:hypothetical protein